MFDYYTSLGVLDVRPTTLAGFQPNIPLLQNLYMYHPSDRWHLLLHHLSFVFHVSGFRCSCGGMSTSQSMTASSEICTSEVVEQKTSIIILNITVRYEYIVNLDNDEVIMPIEHHNWSDMMEEVLPDSIAKQKQA